MTMQTHYPVRLHGVEFRWPIHLELGQSFFVAATDFKAVKEAANGYFLDLGYRLKCIERIENGVLGMRLWRTQ